LTDVIIEAHYPYQRQVIGYGTFFSRGLAPYVDEITWDHRSGLQHSASRLMVRD